jgi:ribonuclease-3
MSVMYDDLELEIGHKFQNKDLLIESLTHPSIKLEVKKSKNYERLEFLGDKVLNFIIAEYLFLEYPNEPEGDISRRHAHAICGEVCAEIAANINIGSYLTLSKAQEKDDGRRNVKILENAIESLIGALYLDAGIKQTRLFILKHWEGRILNENEAPKDPKSYIQEYCQRKYQILPNYETKIVKNEFYATIEIPKFGTFTGIAKTRKESEKNAARNAILKILEQK